MHFTRTLRMSSKWTQRQLIRDHLLSVTTPYLRMSLVSATQSIESGRKKFRIDNSSMTNLYGKTLLSATLVSAFLKGEERCIIQAVSDNEQDPVSRLYGEVTMGELRGFIHLPSRYTLSANTTTLPFTSSSSSSGTSSTATIPGLTSSIPSSVLSAWNGKLSSGSLQVSRILYNQATPLQSITPLLYGDIESDLQYYFEQSEQIPTILRLETQALDHEPYTLTHAFGLIVQRIASSGGKQVSTTITKDGLPWTTYESLHQKISHLSSSSSSPFSLVAYHQQNKPLIAIAKDLVPEIGSIDTEDLLRGKLTENNNDPSLSPVVRRIPLDFFCRCTKDRFLLNLARMGEHFIEELETDYRKQQTISSSSISDESNGTVTSLTCQFCNTHYDVQVNDLHKIREIIHSKNHHQQPSSPSPS